MKYYKPRKYSVDYSKSTFSRCWTCRNACGGCSWSREFAPVKGWTATATDIPENGEHHASFHVIACP